MNWKTQSKGNSVASNVRGAERRPQFSPSTGRFGAFPSRVRPFWPCVSFPVCLGHCRLFWASGGCFGGLLRGRAPPPLVTANRRQLQFQFHFSWDPGGTPRMGHVFFWPLGDVLHFGDRPAVFALYWPFRSFF